MQTQQLRFRLPKWLIHDFVIKINPRLCLTQMNRATKYALVFRRRCAWRKGKINASKVKLAIGHKTKKSQHTQGKAFSKMAHRQRIFIKYCSIRQTNLIVDYTHRTI